MPRSTTLTAAALTALAACAFAAPAASQVTTAGGEVVSTAQKHLVDNLITIDSIQAATAKLAAMKTENPSVKEFANTLAADHAAHAGGLQKVADKKDVGREADPGNPLAADSPSDTRRSSRRRRAPNSIAPSSKPWWRIIRPRFRRSTMERSPRKTTT